VPKENMGVGGDIDMGENKWDLVEIGMQFTCAVKARVKYRF